MKSQDSKKERVVPLFLKENREENVGGISSKENSLC